MATQNVKFPEHLSKLMDILVKYGHTLGYGVLTALTAGGELIFSNTVFKCPCHPTWNLPYGLVFLLVPALALFLLGYWMSTRARLLMTGCCQRANSQGCCLWVNNQGCCTLCCQCCDNFLKMSTVSIVAPLTWVAVALLGGNYYECFASGIPYLARRICVRHTKNCSMILPELPCLRDKEPDLRGLLSKLQAQSQVWRYETPVDKLGSYRLNPFILNLNCTVAGGSESQSLNHSVFLQKEFYSGHPRAGQSKAFLKAFSTAAI
ncbi:PREDICTED: protein FAM26F-like [Condylura cristata]|uniref:protein FAM26F-like n=1 Tax=Condylura cristata TaxID=143302 RepID=UPI00064378A8|nr:PREDICTED: protein FAM26F-like [Condylura cristata]